MTDINYFMVILNAMFTGIGTAAGLYVFEKVIKPRIKHGHKAIKKIIRGKT